MKSFKNIILFNEGAIKERRTNLENKFIILNPDSLADDYKDAKWQLFYATSGFGCNPDASGNAVFGIYCGDGEQSRVERFNVLGTASDEAVEEWKSLYGDFCEETQKYFEKYKEVI